MFSIKTKRSGGVPVTSAVHRMLVKGNAARDQRDWSQAAAAFRQALQAAPGLAHIWVQLGNVTKELGLPDEAEAAYLQAVRLRPDDAEPLLQLGHLFNLANKHAKAGQYYLRAFQADPRLIDAATGLHRMIARARGRKREELVETLRLTMPDTLRLGRPSAGIGTPLPASAAADAGLHLVFDVSDLIGYFAHGRAPTGIQRVQIQIVTQALLHPGPGTEICCFVDGRDDWLHVPVDLFSHIVGLSLKSSDRTDPEWITALHQLHLHLALSRPFTFPRGACLVNLGSSWQLANYFLFVREAKARYGIRYVPFVHDLIPLVAPEHFTKPARREVAAWVLGVFTHADHILVNSEATRRDLMQTCETLGRWFDPGNIAVIRLDADARTAQDDRVAEALPAAALTRWQIEADCFVLLVSTVESRKGHVTALDAWQDLIGRYDPANIPRLVCAGKRGWLSDAVYRRLEENPLLASRVSMLSSVSDAELALLYRTCLFTLYPSLYEGWGLPITESLCYGKPVIASDTSSLPEAGGEFAVYVAPGSPSALASAVERMAFDHGYRDATAERIRAEFRPRSWGDLARQVREALGRMAATPAGALPVAPIPMARMGSYHPVGRGTALRLWPGAGAGEAFRVGTGWSAPDSAGSWTRSDDARLAIGLPPREVPLRVGLLLLGPAACDVDWRLTVTQGPTLSGSLRRGGRKWVTFTYPLVEDDSTLRLQLRSEPSEAEDGQDDGEDEEETTVGLAGFFIYGEGDVKAGMRLLEAIALDNLDSVDAYQENGSASLLAHASAGPGVP